MDTVCVYIPGRQGQHLICRIAQVNSKQFTLYCRRGTLVKRFGVNKVTPIDAATEPLILMKGWQQSKAIGIGDLLDEDLVSCSCRIETPQYHYVGDEEEDSGKVQQHLPEIKTLLHTLMKEDMDTVQHGWLNDNVIAASQVILAQQFPNIKGFQPTILQEVRGFDIQRG